MSFILVLVACFTYFLYMIALSSHSFISYVTFPAIPWLFALVCLLPVPTSHMPYLLHFCFVLQDAA